MRGTLKDTEVERWGGEQARRFQAGSLNPSKTSTFEPSSPNPPPLRFFALHREILSIFSNERCIS